MNNVVLSDCINALRLNNMDVHYVDTKGEVADVVRSLIKPGDCVAVGGSVTLEETGVLALLRSGDYHFLDRYAEGLNRDEVEEIFRRSHYADVYLMSANAVTMNGELYNVDGFGNRIAALTHGPKSVIVVVGVNKLVPDVKEAVERVKTIAAPLNAKRLHKSTPCAVKGRCICVDGDMTQGCSSPDRICSGYLVTGKQTKKGRIKVVLVGESCGY